MTNKLTQHKFSFKLFLVCLAVALIIVASVRLISNTVFPPISEEMSMGDSDSNETNSSAHKLDFTSLENARSLQELQQGLQYRESLCDTCGMLFTFNDERERVFWMPNVPFSIDMIFIDAEGVVVTVHSRAKPNQIEEKYYSKPAKYVLEVPADYADQNQIVEGDKIDIEHLNSQLVSFVWV